MTEEGSLQAMSVRGKDLIKPIRTGKTSSIVVEIQATTRAEIARWTAEVEKEDLEVVAITEEIEDPETIVIVEIIDDAVMTKITEEEVLIETEGTIDKEAMKESEAMIMIEEKKMIEERAVIEEEVIAEIATLEETDQETELEANQAVIETRAETVSLVLTKMIDDAVSLLRTGTAAPQIAT